MSEEGEKWEQGDILSPLESQQLGLHCSYHIVITHDCDLARFHEELPDVELIQLDVLEPTDALIQTGGFGNFTKAKNPKQLCLQLRDSYGSKQTLHLQRKNVRISPWKQLDCLVRSPQRSYIFTEKDKRILREWVASWYARPSFPDAFNDLMNPPRGNPYYEKGNVNRNLTKLFTPHADNIIGLYIGFLNEGGINSECSPYEIELVLVCELPFFAIDHQKTESDKVENMINKILRVFWDIFGDEAESEDVILEQESCSVTPANAITLDKLRSLYKWSFDHISLGKGLDVSPS